MVILIGLPLMFVPGVPGNESSLVRKEPQLASVADALAPNAALKISAFTLRPRQRMCMSAVTVTPRSRIAQFRLYPPAAAGNVGPPLNLLLRAPGYRFAADLASGAYGSRFVEFTITPPPRAVIGTACVLDAGGSAVPLEGTTDPRTTSRSALTLDGKPVTGNLTLRFFEWHRVSKLQNLGEIFERVSNLTDRLVPFWLVWLLAVSALFAVPIGIVAAFHRALREDDSGSAR
jgi:hypothetical protein